MRERPIHGVKYSLCFCFTFLYIRGRRALHHSMSSGALWCIGMYVLYNDLHELHMGTERASAQERPHMDVTIETGKISRNRTCDISNMLCRCVTSKAKPVSSTLSMVLSSAME